MTATAAVVAAVALMLGATPRTQAPELPEIVVAIRVHGNHTTPDTEVIRLAGIATGQPFLVGTTAAVERRLLQSGRFRSVEVRKRYQSLEDASAVVVVIVVEEQAGVAVDVPAPPVLRRLKASTMWLPILSFEDGYGLTYGARFSFIGALGPHTRVSVPATWGGERRVSMDVERRFARGPLTRVTADAGITRREHPAMGVDDHRTGVGVRAERTLSSSFRVGAQARLSDVQFGDVDDHFRSLGVDATLDTRRDPAFPRNALYASLSVERLWFDHADDTPRVLADIRGYAGLVRQVVLVARVQQAWAAHPLPPFEQVLLGGAASLRGFRLGYRTGDRLLAASAEVRVPITSPLRIARTGIAVFTDAGTVYAADQVLADGRWDRSVGAGFFVTATVFSMRLDVAHGFDAGTRAHFALGLAF